MIPTFPCYPFLSSLDPKGRFICEELRVRAAITSKRVVDVDENRVLRPKKRQKVTVNSQK